MSAVLQIISYIDQLETLMISDRDDVRDAIEMIEDVSANKINGQRGLVLGGFTMLMLTRNEARISLAIEQSLGMLAPLGLQVDPILQEPIDFFAIDLDQELLFSLRRSASLLDRRAQAIKEIRDQLLLLSDNDLGQVYSEETMRDFQQTWNQGFSSL